MAALVYFLPSNLLLYLFILLFSVREVISHQFHCILCQQQFQCKQHLKDTPKPHTHTPRHDQSPHRSKERLLSKHTHTHTHTHTHKKKRRILPLESPPKTWLVDMYICRCFYNICGKHSVYLIKTRAHILRVYSVKGRMDRILSITIPSRRTPLEHHYINLVY